MQEVALMSESSHSDLAQAQPRLPAKERRTSVRVSCTIAGSCEPIALPSASGPERQWFGEVRDVSAGGMLLVLPRRFEAGAAVMVELPGETEGSARFIPANVVRVA